jgi:Na+-transporting NADH:ubiquinone oxidoreductase subunit B
MKFLRDLLDKQKPHFVKGGRFEKLHSTFDAFETFLFVPNKVTSSGAHIRDAIDMKRTMIIVVVALLPALIFGIWNAGYQHYLSHGMAYDFWPMFGFGLMKVLPIIIVSYVVGLAIEFAFAQIRHHEVNEGFLVSGMLIPLVMPPDVPLWMVAVATAFAVIIGKEVFGGTGMNILNPALTARAFLFFAYPSEMSGDLVWIADKADAYSGATPLGHLLVGEVDKIPSDWAMFLGTIPGSIGETSTLAILLGAIVLIATGIGSARIMLSVVAGGLAMGWLFNLWGANDYMNIPAYQHLIMGGFAFGAVFMATDPVSAAQTSIGKYYYGFLIGMIAVLIRVFNPAYPEGMMLSILLMNVFAPLIDHYVIQSNIKKRLKRAKLAIKVN